MRSRCCTTTPPAARRSGRSRSACSCSPRAARSQWCAAAAVAAGHLAPARERASEGERKSNHTPSTPRLCRLQPRALDMKGVAVGWWPQDWILAAVGGLLDAADAQGLEISVSLLLVEHRWLECAPVCLSLSPPLPQHTHTPPPSLPCRRRRFSHRAASTRRQGLRLPAGRRLLQP